MKYLYGVYELKYIFWVEYWDLNNVFKKKKE